MFVVRGSSSTANVKDVQFRVLLRADDAGNAPEVFGLNFTYKKSSYSANEAVYTGKTVVDALPKSASVDITATSAYAYANGMRAWRFENMMLMMVNSRGSDALFEEVALNGLDFNEGWGNWAYTIFKAGLFGHNAYTQFAANPTLVQQAIADGNIVGLYVHGGKLETTNSESSSQVIVYAYETQENGTVIFKTVCPRGDVSELANGDVFGTCTAEQLTDAISSFSNANARGMMYVVGSKVKESSVKRVPAAAQIVDAATVRLSVNGITISLPEDFVAQKSSTLGYGVIAYTLASEVKAGEKLAAAKFYYDITVNADGTLALPESLQAKLTAGDTANLYVVHNNGMTYTAKIISVNTLDKQKNEALAKVNDYLANQPSNVYGEAAKIANQARALIEAASSIEGIEAALKLLDTKLDYPWQDDNKGTTAGGNTTVLPPQTGDAENFAPFMLIVMAMAAVLFVACRRKRS